MPFITRRLKIIRYFIIKKIAVCVYLKCNLL
nr:MAG TPA: hypothetical protein [Caudoviricetes sp.]